MISSHPRVGLTLDIQLTRSVSGKPLWQVGVLGINHAVGVFDPDLLAGINRASKAFIDCYPDELPHYDPMPGSTPGEL